MLRWKILSTICLLLTILAQSARSENVLELFVRSKMEAYSSWTKDNNLDPSPVEPGPTYIPISTIFVTLDCDLNDHNVKGHSENIQLTSIKADLSRIAISFVVQQNVTFSGTYSAFGTVGLVNRIPIEGQGHWHITLPELLVSDLYLDYVVDCDGFVQITNCNLDALTIPYNPRGKEEVYFENLWENVEDESYKRYIQTDLYDGFRKYWDNLGDEDNPLKWSFLQHFREAFANATWVEIIVPTISSKPVSVSTGRNSVRSNVGHSEKMSENSIENFVRDKLGSYPIWIQDNNLDPSSSVPGPTTIGISSWWVKLDCNLSDHIVQGHSQAIKITSLKADLDGVLVSFTVPGSITFSGNYKANGTVGLNDIPISGEGAWNISVPEVIFKDIYFNYTISPDNKVHVESYNLDGIELPYSSGWNSPEMHFENLWDSLAESDKSDVKRALYDGYSEYMSADKEHSLKQMYRQYFEQIFNTTNWTEIVGPTLETCTNLTTTTVTPTSPTTTTRRTTLPTTTTTTSSTTTPPGNVIVQFVRNKLAEYPAWMKVRNLDPSPSVLGPTHIKAETWFSVKLDCYLSNHIVENHSDGLRVTSIAADLSSISMSLELQENVTFSGNYIANGTLGFDAKPINGDGTWYIYEPIVVIHNVFLNFSILSDGHPFITLYKFDGPSLPSYYNSEGDVFFENLWDEGVAAEYKDSLQEALYDEFKEYIVKVEGHPFKQTYNQYFQEVFANTTWEEIVGPTDPPTSTTPPPGNGLKQFVTSKLAGYGAWLQDNNLDPSPKVTGPTQIEANKSMIVKMDCYLSNHVVENYSNGITVSSVRGDLGSISVSLEVQGAVTFTGRYLAHGTVGWESPIRGDGLWNISVSGMTFQDLHFDFAISSAGYVTIINYHVDGPYLPNFVDGEADVYFENLWESGYAAEYKEDIQEALFEGFSRHLIEDLTHPLKQSYLQYFQQAFANTTWADIIAP